MTYTTEALSQQIGACETERRFVWLADAETEGARVEIAPLALYERDGGFTDKNTRTVVGTTSPVRREGSRLSYKVRVGGLTPGTDYVYRVGCNTALDSRIHSFTLPDHLDRKQSFFLVSDLHINVYRRAVNAGDPDGRKALARWERTLAQAEAFGDAPAFFLSLGDNASVANMGADFYPDPSEYSPQREDMCISTPLDLFIFI